MAKKSFRICVFILLAAGAALWLGKPLAAMDQGRGFAAIYAKYPQMFGQVGPYAVEGTAPASDLNSFAHDGMTWFTGYFAPGSPNGEAVQSNHLGQIDTYLEWLLYQECKAENPDSMTKHSCTISPEGEQKLLTAIAKHLQATAADPAVYAYYILDDYPGPVKSTLEKIAALVHEANKTSVFPRPTLCGFAGTLDVRDTPAGAFKPRESQPDNAFKTAITNFSPAACDFVSFYPYGVRATDDRSLVDWSLSRVLPAYKALLAQAGWVEQNTPMIPILDTFGYVINANYYVTPTADDVFSQIKTYCDAGAVSLLAFAWNDNRPGPVHELFNDADLRAGLQKGAAYCRAHGWSQRNSQAAAPNSPTTR